MQFSIGEVYARNYSGNYHKKNAYILRDDEYAISVAPLNRGDVELKDRTFEIDTERSEFHPWVICDLFTGEYIGICGNIKYSALMAFPVIDDWKVADLIDELDGFNVHYDLLKSIKASPVSMRKYVTAVESPAYWKAYEKNGGMKLHDVEAWTRLPKDRVYVPCYDGCEWGIKEGFCHPYNGRIFASLEGDFGSLYDLATGLRIIGPIPEDDIEGLVFSEVAAYGMLKAYELSTTQPIFPEVIPYWVPTDYLDLLKENGLEWYDVATNSYAMEMRVA